MQTNLPEFSHCSLCFRELTTASSLASTSWSFCSLVSTSFVHYYIIILVRYVLALSAIVPLTHIVDVACLVRVL